MVRSLSPPDPRVQSLFDQSDALLERSETIQLHATVLSRHIRELIRDSERLVAPRPALMPAKP